MNAPPISNINDFNLNKINCFELNHQNNPILGICNDPKCDNNNKFMCVDCIFGNHSGHIGIKINEIEKIVSKKLEEYHKQNENFNKNYNEFKIFLRNKVNELKDKINNYIEDYYTNFLKKINQICIINEIDNIQKKYPPKNKEDLNKLGKELLDLYNNKNNNNNSEIKLPNLKIYEKLVIDEIKNCENYLIKFKESPIDLEEFKWSTKTYGEYGFYYKLEENNTKVTKISEKGTITICRTISPLKLGYKYKLDYFIYYINGDFDVGFGDDNIGNSCWLSTQKSYCVSNRGIYVSGINKNSNVNIKNIKKISFIIDLKKFLYDIYFDDNKMYSFSFESNLIYYPMIAIRALNNSVTLKVERIDN